MKRNGRLAPEEKHSPRNSDDEEEEEGEEGKAGASKRPVQKRVPAREDNVACTKEACLYKSHFVLRSLGEVGSYYSIEHH